MTSVAASFAVITVDHEYLSDCLFTAITAFLVTVLVQPADVACLSGR